MKGRAGARGGFALITVIWGVAIIALLVVSFMTTARLQLQGAFNLAGATKADYIAEAAIGAAFMTLMAERESTTVSPGQSTRHDGSPKLCALDGAAVVVALEDESGKIDLNGGADKTFSKLFVGLGVDRREADAIAAAIVFFRQPPQEGIAADLGGGSRPFPPKHALFQSVLELDQVEGMTPQLFAAALPFLTVHSRRPDVDRNSAPPALFAALAGYPPQQVEALRLHPYPNNLDRNDPKYPREFNQRGGRTAALAHVETMLPSGQTSVREAVFDLNDGRGPAFALKERRRGVVRYLDDLRRAIASGVGMSDC